RERAVDGVVARSRDLHAHARVQPGRGRAPRPARSAGLLMEALLKDALKISGFVLLVVLVLGYFAKLVIENVIDAAFKRRERAEEDLLRRMDEIGKTSLDIKKGLRQEEREELVALRVAVEKWQYFLETAVFDFSMLDPAKADVRTLYERA